MAQNNTDHAPHYSPQQWEKRWHPLRGEWVLLAGHRDNRPWLGGSVPAHEEAPPYDPSCYLCPGNERARGERNPDYPGVFAFDNDFPPASPHAPNETSAHGIYRAERAGGRCRVVCFHPRHDLTLARMSLSDIEEVVACWQREYRELGDREDVNHVLIFENKGSIVGVSNPHPHCQIYGTDFVFQLIETEVRLGREYYAENRRTLYGAIIDQERADDLRIVTQNDTMVAFMPYFARYAYEVHIAPFTSHRSVADLTDAESADFAAILKTVLVKYDNLFNMPFPYVMTFHQAPTDGQDHTEFHFHVEIYPPLRNPVTQKFLAGPEIGGGNMLADTAPEQKVKELRAAAPVHYMETA